MSVDDTDQGAGDGNQEDLHVVADLPIWRRTAAAGGSADIRGFSAAGVYSLTDQVYCFFLVFVAGKQQ